MKKVVYLVGAMLLSGSLMVGASEIINKNVMATVSLQDDDTKKEKVEVDQLPQAVKNTLEGDDYKGWTIDSAYKVNKDGNEFYKVKLTKGSDTKVVKLDKDGKVVL